MSTDIYVVGGPDRTRLPGLADTIPRPGVSFATWAPGASSRAPTRSLPTSRLDLLAYTYNGTIGQLIIGPDGAMYADGSDADQYTSLAGVSFPVAGTALTPLALYSGWHSGLAQFGAGNPGYVITDGIVHWTGSLTTTNTPNTGYPGNYFAMVPAAAHADRCLNATVYTDGDHVGNMAIWPPSTVYNSRDMFVSDTPGGHHQLLREFHVAGRYLVPGRWNGHLAAAEPAGRVGGGHPEFLLPVLPVDAFLLRPESRRVSHRLD